MIKINLHGKLGKDLGEHWSLDVSNVAEGLRAIEANTRKFRKWILNHIKEYEYEILVDKTNLFTESPNFKSIEEFKNSEFYVNLEERVEVIDIVPILVGSGDVWKIVTGGVAVVGAIALGVFYPPAIPFAVGLGLAGLGLIAYGTSELLSKPPPTVPFTAEQINPIEGDGGSSGPTSYLFNGPVNTVGEGGPVPIGYGELIVGGNNVYANYDIIYRVYKTNAANTTTNQTDPQGVNQFLFNSRCYPISQSKLTSSPF